MAADEYDPTDCELGICGPCDACLEQEARDQQQDFIELGDEIPEVRNVSGKGDDGCKASAPTHEHDGITYHRMAPGDLMICQASKYEPPEDADFASLLEREPDMEDQLMVIRNDLAAQLGTARATIGSQAARIKSLEDVLVAIRAKAAEGAKLRTGVPSETLANMRRVYLEEISQVIAETLDPCKPWCVLADTGRKHEGACVPIEGDDRGD